jgi:hypothetical protein
MEASFLVSNAWFENMQYHAIAVICSPVFAFEVPPQFDPGQELCKDSLDVTPQAEERR